MSKKRLRNTRCKAGFGAAASAAVQAAAILAASAANVKAQSDAAKKQAAALTQSAQTQAQALQQQSENNNQLQQQSQDFIANQNQQARDLQTDIQMTLQRMAGEESNKDRELASRIVVKRGGKTRGNAASLLRGGYNGNMPFRITDGGGVIPIGKTPEGFDVYEIYGNDHKHYHKTRSGKYKSGVGFKFADGEVVEGEGNQRSNQGELFVNTPDGGYFLSKHSIAGFRPADAVLAGYNPNDVFAMQEQIKAMKGLSDDGSSSPVERSNHATFGTLVNPTLLQYASIPELNTDMIIPMATGAAIKYKSTPKLKYGGRPKALMGSPYTWDYGLTNYKRVITTPTSNSASSKPVSLAGVSTNGTNPIEGDSSTNSFSRDYLTGAGITAGANLLGALLSNVGANRAGRTLASGYNRAGDILANAYLSMKGVDMNTLRRDDYRAAHAMPAIISPYVNVNPQLDSIARGLQAGLKQVNNTTLSSAARNTRSSYLRDVAAQQRNEIYAKQANMINERQAENAKLITQTANENANRDTQALKDFSNSYLQLLQYNNDIANQSLLGAAQARADAITQSSGALASARQQVGANWGNALGAAGGAFGTAFGNIAKTNADFDMISFGMSMPEAIQNAIRRGDIGTLRRYQTYLTRLNPSNPNLKTINEVLGN